MVAELYRKESFDTEVEAKDSQLWARSPPRQRDVGDEQRNEVEQEEEGLYGWEGRRKVDGKGRWPNLPGLLPACDEG